MADTTTDQSKTASSSSSSSSSSTSTTTTTSGSTYDSATRLNGINNMYDAQKQNSLNELKTAYDQNMSDAVAARDKIPDQYQNSYNDLSSEYERQRRNNNLAAQANGLNTGASSQMNLAQTNAYLANKSSLQQQENEALNDANKNITDLKTNYQNQIAEAASSSDYNRAAALLDEYNNQYEQMSTQASTMASFGDFSGYASLYGQAAADQMQKGWAMQNPDQAWALGYMTSDEYFMLTGKQPNANPSLTSSTSSGGGGYSGAGGNGYLLTNTGVMSDSSGKNYGVLMSGQTSSTSGTLVDGFKGNIDY